MIHTKLSEQDIMNKGNQPDEFNCKSIEKFPIFIYVRIAFVLILMPFGKFNKNNVLISEYFYFYRLVKIIDSILHAGD